MVYSYNQIMKITLFTFILYSLSLTAVAGINNEIQAKLHPKYLLNPVGECIRSQRDKCIFPSISQLKIAAEEFDEGFKKVVKEALVKAEDFDKWVRPEDMIGPK